MSDTSTILIVDDTLKNITLLETLLVKQGYNIAVCTDGISAIAVCKTDPPDLILLDIIMPDMSGYEVCEILKNNQHLKNIPIIFISSLDQQADIVKGFQLGAVDYISKPIKNEEVLARVNTHLKLQSTQNQLKKLNRSLEATVARKTKELLESEERLSLALDASREGIYVINLITKSFYRDQKYIEILRQDSNELSDVFEGVECVHPDDLEDVENRLNYFLKSNVPFFKIRYRIQLDKGEFLGVLTDAKS